MNEITAAQREARRANVAVARGARKSTAAARREAVDATLDSTYGPVGDAIAKAHSALQSGDTTAAATAIATAQLELAQIAVLGTFDPGRSRAAMLSLREAAAECKRRLG